MVAEGLSIKRLLKDSCGIVLFCEDKFKGTKNELHWKSLDIGVTQTANS